MILYTVDYNHTANMKKLNQVYLVPTDKNLILSPANCEQRKFTILKPNVPENGNLLLMKGRDKWYYDIQDAYTPQYIYFTSDEEIKEGDWVLDTNSKIVCKFSGNAQPPEFIKKITATTNKELWGNPQGKCRGELELLGGDGEFGEMMSEPLYMRCKICGDEDFYSEENAQEGCDHWSEEWIVKGTDKIPQSFIDTYIKAYNEGKKITEVLVEGEFRTAIRKDGCPFEKQSENGAYMAHDEHGWEILYPEHTIRFENFTPKLNSAGEVEWSLKEERMYTREDMEKAYDVRKPDYRGYPGLEKSYLEEKKEWFNKNYPQ